MAKNNYVLTLGALEDIREIGDRSFHHWGKEKTVAYLTDLHQGLEFLAENFKTFENNKTRDDFKWRYGFAFIPYQQALCGFCSH